MTSFRVMLSHPRCVMMINQLTKPVKTKLGDRVEVLHYMDGLKASTTSIRNAEQVHLIVKKYAVFGIVINSKKSTIQLSFKTPVRESPGHPRD